MALRCASVPLFGGCILLSLDNQSILLGLRRRCRLMVKNITRCSITGEGECKGNSGGSHSTQVRSTHTFLVIIARPSIAAQLEMSGYPCRSSQQQSAQGLDGGQIRALFDNCLKLASENKITAKNTWDLPLIDHLSDLVQVLGPYHKYAPEAWPPARPQQSCGSAKYLCQALPTMPSLLHLHC